MANEMSEARSKVWLQCRYKCIYQPLDLARIEVQVLCSMEDDGAVTDVNRWRVRSGLRKAIEQAWEIGYNQGREAARTREADCE